MTNYLNSTPLLAALVCSFAIGVITETSHAQSVILNVAGEEPCPIPLQANSSVTVDATSGNLAVTLDDMALPDCFGSTAVTALDVSLTIDPVTIEGSETVDVSWSVAGFIDDVTTCIPTGGTQEWRNAVTGSPSGGTGTFSPPSSTTFTIACENSADSESVAVTVNGMTGEGADGFPDPPVDCGPLPAGRMLPFNTQRGTAINPPNGQPKRNFEEAFGAYPGVQEVTVKIPRGDYVALPFFADLPEGTVSRLTWVGGPANGNATQVSISRCPGDFNGLGGIGYSDIRCLATSGSEGGVILSIIGSGNACPLVGGANEVYYMNIRHTDSNGANACNDGSVCDFLGIP